jgi:outer membrane protein assembly factor BamA
MITSLLRNRSLPVILLAPFLLLPSFGGAQTTRIYKLAAIQFAGLQRYTAEQGTAASGLQVGNSIMVADLQSAANRLSKSGAFDSVSFQYSTQGDNLTAHFGVHETANVLPCIFDNFIWFTDGEIDGTLRRQVTFYAGNAPVAGDTVPEIRRVLQDLLRSNGIPGEVNELAFGKMGKAVSALLFRIDGISQPIKTIAFSGQNAVTTRQLTDASATLLDQDFSYTNVDTYAEAALLPLYYQRGYLRSQFGRAKVALIETGSKGPTTDVAIMLPVVEGNQYFWDRVSWSGNQTLTVDELGKDLGMNAKEVANQEKIDAGFVKAHNAYLSEGYINARLVPTRELDDAAKLARYTVQVSEGEQFHMGRVYFDGVPDRAAKALMTTWKLRTGDVYDGTYPNEFVKNTAIKEIAEQGLNLHTTVIKQEPDPNTRIVDLHFQFQ